jgi:hypothetical protein
MGEQTVGQMLGAMQQGMPSVPQQFWTDMRTELTAAGMVELVVPLYAKHFTDEEIRQLVAFYRSPVGQKLVREQPALLQEGIAAGQVWGQQATARVMLRLKEKGYQ